MHAYEYKYYVFCQSCTILIKLGEKCSLCEMITKKTKDNYFIYIPIKPQIKAMLDKHLPQILHHLNETRNENDYCDVLDGKIFKEANKKNPGIVILPLTVNIDGAKIFTSSKASLWPIQRTMPICTLSPLTHTYMNGGIVYVHDMLFCVIRFGITQIEFIYA